MYCSTAAHLKCSVGIIKSRPEYSTWAPVCVFFKVSPPLKPRCQVIAGLYWSVRLDEQELLHPLREDKVLCAASEKSSLSPKGCIHSEETRKVKESQTISLLPSCQARQFMIFSFDLENVQEIFSRLQFGVALCLLTQMAAIESVDVKMCWRLLAEVPLAFFVWGFDIFKIFFTQSQTCVRFAVNAPIKRTNHASCSCQVENVSSVRPNVPTGSRASRGNSNWVKTKVSTIISLNTQHVQPWSCVCVCVNCTLIGPIIVRLLLPRCVCKSGCWLDV